MKKSLTVPALYEPHLTPGVYYQEHSVASFSTWQAVPCHLYMSLSSHLWEVI